jgi:hypothetical protein
MDVRELIFGDLDVRELIYGWKGAHIWMEGSSYINNHSLSVTCKALNRDLQHVVPRLPLKKIHTNTLAMNATSSRKGTS